MTKRVHDRYYRKYQRKQLEPGEQRQQKLKPATRKRNNQNLKPLATLLVAGPLRLENLFFKVIQNFIKN